MPPPEDEVVGAMPGIRPPKPLVITSDNMANAWKLWLQQFDWYAVANKLSRQPPEVQVAVFMASIGADAIRIYNTFSLTTAQSKDLQVIKDKFAAKFSPTPNESYVQYQFFKLVQREGESFEDFLTTAEMDIKTCGFGTLEVKFTEYRMCWKVTMYLSTCLQCLKILHAHGSLNTERQVHVTQDQMAWLNAMFRQQRIC